MAERPRGTVTFLFTDIEGSTRLLHELGAERYGTALEEHRRIIRDAVARHGGHEVDTQGDAFLVAFGRATDAVLAAEEAQRDLASQPWPDKKPVLVRMGIHTTEVSDAGEGYVGVGVHRGARIGAAGHGGQVLVSQATADLLRDEQGIGLRDLGEYRLKDFDRAQRIYQLEIAGLPSDFPPLKAPSVHLTNLQPELTSFIGRQRELLELRTLCEGHRLVTLVGVGGTGKTRLMVEAGAQMLDRFADGVWLAELAPISDPELVPAQIARSLGLSEEPGRKPIDTLLDFLSAKALLLLIDNCEHLIEAAAQLADQILRNSPSIAILATSREALGLEGEVAFQVPSLGLPVMAPAVGAEAPEAADGEVWLNEIAASEAVRLFTDRAKALSPSFSLTPANVRAVLDICRRLDGIPLAIELAAARVNVLSAEEIDAGLGDRFRLLTGARRGALPRQQTLQALIDWSWDLLSEDDRRLLARLSVFAGAWSLDAATAIVSAADGIAPNRMATLDGLARLVDRSLVVAEQGQETRYRMLETIRQYARNRLMERGEADALRAAHLAYYLDRALQAEHPLMGPDMLLWLGRLDREIDELRAALTWGLDSDPEHALRMTVALVPYWRARAFGSEAVDQIVRAASVAESLPAPGADAMRERTILVARVLAAAGHAESVWGSGSRGFPYAERAVALAAETDDLEANADALGAKAMAAAFSGRTEGALTLHDAVLDLAERRGDPWTVAMVEAGAALAELGSGDVAAAQRRQAHATEAADRSGNPFAMAFARLNSGRITAWAGRLDEARRWFAEALDGYREIGDHRFEIVARSDLAHALRRGGALDEAEEVYRETIRAWQHLGSRGAIASQLESFAFLALARNDSRRAARLLGAAEILRVRVDAVMLPYERIEYDRYLEQLRESPDPAMFEEEWGAGRAMSMEDAITIASPIRHQTADFTSSVVRCGTRCQIRGASTSPSGFQRPPSIGLRHARTSFVSLAPVLPSAISRRASAWTSIPELGSWMARPAGEPCSSERASTFGRSSVRSSSRADRSMPPLATTTSRPRRFEPRFDTTVLSRTRSTRSSSARRLPPPERKRQLVASARRYGEAVTGRALLARDRSPASAPRPRRSRCPCPTRVTRLDRCRTSRACDK
jgi:predicted ATPase/class 3 adenylate cyclase